MISIKNAVENWDSTLDYPYNLLYDIIGYDGIETICNSIGGTTLYIPSLQHMFKAAIIDQMQKDFNGTNYRDMALSYGLTERTVRNYIVE